MKIKSIRYSGSKDKILPKITNILDNIDYATTLDGFSGSTRVSSLFKSLGKTSHSNDLAIYSKVIAETYLLGRDNKQELYDKIQYLNSLKPIDGWFTETYGGEWNDGTSVQSDGLKRPFYIDVTRKLDAIRDEIDKMYPNDCVDKSILLTSLLIALDSRCNDLGHQVAYLKDWASRTQKPLMLELPTWTPDELKHKVTCNDVFDLNGKYDLVYFDPPYGTANQKTKTTRVRYFSYYHLWTTIVKNDKPKVFGAAKRREEFSSDTIDGAISDFEHLKDNVVIDSFRRLLTEFDTKYTLISYSNRSKIPIDNLIDLVSDNQQLVDVHSFKHKENSQANSVINSEYKVRYDEENLEYLILSKTK
jgi:adenine-specific DNA-methyltransferase